MPVTLKASTIKAIEHLLGNSEKSRVFSMAGAVESVRSLAPNCELMDSELAEVIAAHAVGMGFLNVAFDREVEQIGMEKAGRPQSLGV